MSNTTLGSCPEGFSRLDYSIPSFTCAVETRVFRGIWGFVAALNVLTIFFAIVCFLALKGKQSSFKWSKLILDPTWRMILTSLLYAGTQLQVFVYLVLLLLDYRIYTHRWMVIVQLPHEIGYWFGAGLFVYHLIDTYERTNMNKSKRVVARRLGLALLILWILFVLSRIVGVIMHFQYSLTIFMKIYGYSIALFCLIFTLCTIGFGFQLNAIVKEQLLNSQEKEKSRQRLLLGVGGPTFSAVPAIIVVMMAAYDYHSWITEGLVYLFATLGCVNTMLLLFRLDDISFSKASKASASRGDSQKSLSTRNNDREVGKSKLKLKANAIQPEGHPLADAAVGDTTNNDADREISDDKSTS